MKAVRFLPLVFVVGIDGFAMFAPYVVLLLSAVYVIRRARTQPRPQLIPIDR